MKGDFTRLTFNPVKHYAGVLMQQGRVQLDADWNEQVATQAYRWEQQTIDTIGHCGAPMDNAGFEIKVLDPTTNAISIGPGHMYVGGHLCESHGTQTYTTQAQYPGAPALATGLVAGDTQVLYLDVWDRHVTAVEDPSLQEVALGGADTASRIQTVWQVKGLKVSPAATCETAAKELFAKMAPPTGRLSSQATGAAQATDLCQPHPTGGYRGLENRLYRVEIHSGGELGGAGAAPTFKWSRDNGSVLAAVEEINGTNQIVVATLGRDDLTRFQADQWVEVLGDTSELRDRAGILTKITVDPDTATRTITVAANIAGVATEQNMRLRRWDMPSGAVTVAAGPIQLEDGVEVSFSKGTYQPGDYWVFAARVATGAVEVLTNAEPMGIKHAYCPLAVLLWKASPNGVLYPEKISDCRQLFPPLTKLPKGGCCTHVEGGPHFADRLQKAINELPKGGCVCIAAGYHMLEHPIIIAERHKLSVHGHGARLIYQNKEKGDPAIFVVGSTEIELSGLALYAQGVGPAIRIQSSQQVRVSECWLVNLPKAGNALAVEIGEGNESLEFARCTLLADGGWMTLADVKGLILDRCHVRASVLGLYAKGAEDLHVLGCRITGLTEAELATLAKVSLKEEQYVAQSFEPELHKLFATGADEGVRVPLGVAALTAMRLQVEGCSITAGMGLLVGIAVNGQIHRNMIAGFLGIVVGFSMGLQIGTNMIVSFLTAIWGAGLALMWGVHHNVCISASGVRFSPLDLEEILLVLNGTRPGSANAPADGESMLTKAFLTQMGKNHSNSLLLTAVTQGVTSLGQMLSVLKDAARAYSINVESNVLVCMDTGVAVELGSMSGDVVVTGNTISLARVYGIQLHGRATGTQVLGNITGSSHQVSLNRLVVSGMGISVLSDGAQVSHNHVRVSGGGMAKVRAASAAFRFSAFPKYAVEGMQNGDGGLIELGIGTVAHWLIEGEMEAAQVAALAQHLGSTAVNVLKANSFVTEAKLVQLTATAMQAGDQKIAGKALQKVSALLAAAAANAAIRLGASDCSAVDNTVEGQAGARGGVLLYPKAAFTEGLLQRLTVRGNQIQGGGGHGVDMDAAVRGVTVFGNEITRMDWNGISTTGNDQLIQDVEIAHNRVIECRRVAGQAHGSKPAGIFLGTASGVRLLDNQVEQNGQTLSEQVDGILVEGVADLTVRGNHAAKNGGATGDHLGGVGVHLVECRGSVEVCENHLSWNWSRALEVTNTKESPQKVKLMVTSNSMSGGFQGHKNLVFVSGRNLIDALVSNNQITYQNAKTEDWALSISVNNAVVMGNIIDEGQANPLFLSASACTVVGNITKNPLTLLSSPPLFTQVGLNVQH